MAEGFLFPNAPLELPIKLKRLVDSFERRLIVEALDRAGGNQRRAAADLGVLPTTLNEKMRRHGLRACDRSGVGVPAEGGPSPEASAEAGPPR